MSTPILGPLQNGLRIQFAIEYDLPATIDSSYGDIIITDSLPDGLSWYSTNNSDNNNKVFIGNIQKVANVVFGGAGQNVTVTIPNYMLLLPGNPGKKLLVIIEAQFNSL